MMLNLETHWHPSRRVASHACLAMLALLAASGLSSLSAQFTPGDMVIAPGAYTGGPSGRFHILGVTPSGKVYSIQAPSFDTVYGLMPSPDNRSVWISGKGRSLPQGVYRLDPKGSFATVVPFSTARLLGPDGSGGILALQWTVGLVGIGPSGSITTLYPSPNLFNAAAGVDTQTGDIILDQSQATERIRLGANPTLTTIGVRPLAAPRFNGLLTYDPKTDLMLGGTDGGPLPPWLGVLSVRSGVNAVRVTEFRMGQGGSVECVDVDAASRMAFVSVRTPVAPRYSRVLAYDLATLTVIGPVLTGGPSLMLYASFAVRASTRHLCAMTRAQRGGTFVAMVSFPAEPSATYVAGFSFAMRPNIRDATGRTIFLQPDPLLALSLSANKLVRGGTGTLDASGEAVVQLSVPPASPLAGLRIFASAVTIVGGRINSISPPLGVTIQ